MKQPTDTEMLDWIAGMEIFGSYINPDGSAMIETGQAPYAVFHGKDLRDCITKAMQEDKG